MFLTIFKCNCFLYSGYILLLARTPDNQFIEQETKEAVAILNSFRNAD